MLFGCYLSFDKLLFFFSSVHSSYYFGLFPFFFFASSPFQMVIRWLVFKLFVTLYIPIRPKLITLIMLDDSLICALKMRFLSNFFFLFHKITITHILHANSLVVSSCYPLNICNDMLIELKQNIFIALSCILCASRNLYFVESQFREFSCSFPILLFLLVHFQFDFKC